MKLQQRDLEILCCCYEQQFLTIEQIEGFYFKSAHGNKARERVRELSKAGLVRTEKSQLASIGKIVRLTKAGEKLAAANVALAVPQARKLDLATLMHDSIVTSVRLRLRELWDGRWIPERALRDKYEIIPDGIVQFESGFSIAVEIENSLKGKARFLGLIETWSKVESVSLILYVATSRQLERLIHGYLQERSVEKMFGLVCWDDLKAGVPAVQSPAGALPLFEKRTL